MIRYLRYSDLRCYARHAFQYHDRAEGMVLIINVNWLTVVPPFASPCYPTFADQSVIIVHSAIRIRIVKSTIATGMCLPKPSHFTFGCERAE